MAVYSLERQEGCFLASKALGSMKRTKREWYDLAVQRMIEPEPVFGTMKNNCDLNGLQPYELEVIEDGPLSCARVRPDAQSKRAVRHDNVVDRLFLPVAHGHLDGVLQLAAPVVFDEEVSGRLTAARAGPYFGAIRAIRNADRLLRKLLVGAGFPMDELIGAAALPAAVYLAGDKLAGRLPLRPTGEGGRFEAGIIQSDRRYGCRLNRHVDVVRERLGIISIYRIVSR